MFREAAERREGVSPLRRGAGDWLALVARHRRQVMTVLVGAALMAAAGALAGSQMQLDELELRPVRGPHLHVLPGQAFGQVGVTIP